jgi:predicted translin family RNA/ssDNA-binding protein
MYKNINKLIEAEILQAKSNLCYEILGEFDLPKDIKEGLRRKAEQLAKHSEIKKKQ